MKRWIFLLLLALLLTGCAEAGPMQEVNVWGAVFTVDKQAFTISDEDYTYIYILPVMTDDTIRIIYPNGSWYQQSGDNVASAGWSNDYDGTPFSPYAAGETLVQAVKQATEKKQIPARNLIAGCVFLPWGIVNAIWPELGWALWSLRHAAFVKDAEPTEFALGFGRVAGILFIVIGIAAFFVW